MSQRGLEGLLDRTGPLYSWNHSSCGRCTGQTSQHYSMGMGGRLSPIPSWGTTDSWWFLGEGGSVFFKAVAPGRSPRLQWMAPHPGIYEQYRFYISVGYLKTKSFLNEAERVGRWCWIWVALVGEAWTDQDTLCTCRIVSKNKCWKIIPVAPWLFRWANLALLLTWSEWTDSRQKC